MYRLSGRSLKQEFERRGDMLHILLRYTPFLLAQMAQTADCNRLHNVKRQLCRWCKQKFRPPMWAKMNFVPGLRIELPIRIKPA